jgi:hypothetical protein
MSLMECGLHGRAHTADGAIAGYLDAAHHLKSPAPSGRRLWAPTGEPVQTARRALNASYAMPDQRPLPLWSASAGR